MSNDCIILFDVDEFRIAFPAFDNVEQFPDDTLQAYWDAATCYISNKNYGWLRGDCRRRALNLMTAHLTATSVIIAAGKTSRLVQSATIDKVTVSLTPPPLANQWQWWLSTTPYGMQLLALLQAKATGGFYFGGLPETLAFRKFAGRF